MSIFCGSEDLQAFLKHHPARKVEPGDELVDPSGDDGLAGGVAGRMVVVALSKGLVSASQRAHALASTA